jgi:hypothetical protein
MNRVYLPLLPLPVLAVIVAVSACSEPRPGEATRVIPPAEKLLLAPAQAQTPPAVAPPAAVASAPAPEEKPSAEDLKEFHRAVRK